MPTPRKQKRKQPRRKPRVWRQGGKETKSVEAGREENLTSFGAGHDTATLGQLRPIFSIEIHGFCLCWQNRQVSTPVPGRLHRAPRKSGVEPVQAVQAVQAVDEPQVERVEVSQAEKAMAKPEMEPLEIQDVEAVKEEKLEELDDAKSEQKTVKTGPVDHDETKTLKMPKDGKDSTIPAVRVWEPDTFDQDVDELKKRFQKASQQADASKSRETPQLADPVVDTSTARSGGRLDATQVVDLPGSAVEPGTEDPPDPLATAVATAVATATSELRATPVEAVEAEVGGAVGRVAWVHAENHWNHI